MQSKTHARELFQIIQYHVAVFRSQCFALGFALGEHGPALLELLPQHLLASQCGVPLCSHLCRKENGGATCR